MKSGVLLIGVLAVGAICFAGCQVTRAGYESAPYKLVSKDGGFEVRDYPEFSVAETRTGELGRGDADSGFMRLFGFISGRNEAKVKIPMTTPVLISGDEGGRTMAFVLPKQLRGTAPRPTEELVKVGQSKAGQFAVFRFKGRRTALNESESLQRLKVWMKGANLRSTSEPVFAYFDPPWTPWFLRRNEVMLRLQ